MLNTTGNECPGEVTCARNVVGPFAPTHVMAALGSRRNPSSGSVGAEDESPCSKWFRDVLEGHDWSLCTHSLEHTFFGPKQDRHCFRDKRNHNHTTGAEVITDLNECFVN